MRGRKLTVALFILLFGGLALVNALGNPRLRALHGSDVVQLVAVGLCWGAGGVLLVQWLARRRR